MDWEALSRMLTRRYGEDASQHALMRVWEHPEHPEPIALARACARNYFLNEQRPHLRTGHFVGELGEDSVEGVQSPAQEARAMLREVPPELLLPAMGYSELETAAAVGVAPGTIKSRRSRIRSRRE